MTHILNLLWHTCHIIHRFIFKKNTYPYVLISFILVNVVFHIKIFLIFHSPARVHGVISFSSLLQNRHSTISKKSMFRCYPFDHAVKKNKSKFHLYLWEKNNLLLGSTFESRWNQGYIYILYIDGKKIPVVKCNLIESAAMPRKKNVKTFYFQFSVARGDSQWARKFKMVLAKNIREVK